MKKTSLYGLHLWSIKISYNNGQSRAGLWITTKRQSELDASEKYCRFIKKKNKLGEYQNAQVRKIQYKGFLDA